MPCGPNSLARLCDNDLRANLPVEKAAVWAEPFMAAVAPVKMSVGGYFESAEFRSRGSTACEKRKAPRLEDRRPVS